MSIIINGTKIAGTPVVDTVLSVSSNNPIANSPVATAINTLQAANAAITVKIPSQASADNQLADKAFVNSSINNIAAFYITKDIAGNPFSTKAELDAATVYYSGGTVRVPTRNDYTVVLADESKTSPAGETPTTRYLYNGGWEYQYVVNNTGFTAAQFQAINSGITSQLVSKIGTSVQNVVIAGTTASLVVDGTATLPVNAANALVQLGSDGKIPSSQLPPMDYAPSSHLTDAGAHGELFGAKLSLTGGTMTGAVNAAITSIPAATSALTLGEHPYTHAPSNSTTYTMPDITDSTVTHTIFLTVDMTTTASIAFVDADGNAVTAKTATTPAVGECWQFMAEWSAVKSRWFIYGYKEA